MMNRKKRAESSNSSGGYEGSRSYDDATEKGKRALVDRPGESKQNSAQPEEIPDAAAAQMSMKPCKNVQETHRSLAKLPPPTNTIPGTSTDRQSSLVAAALSEESYRKTAAVPRWSTTNATTTITTLQSPPSLPSNPPQLQPQGPSSGAEAQLQQPRQIPSLLNQQRFGAIRLHQQLLLYQQQQQQQQQEEEQERLLRQNLLSFNPQGMIHNLNYQSNLQQQLAMNERLQQHASAMPHRQSYNNSFTAGMVRQLRMEQIDEQVRQRQLMELALLQNQQRHLWTTVNNERHSIIPTIPNQPSQPSTTKMDDAVAAAMSTNSTAASSHIVEQNNATIDSALKKYLLVTTTTARPPKKKPENTGKDPKSNKNKSSKMDDDAPLEYNFEPENMKELSLPTDKENLSKYQCLLRHQIVLFTVGAADIQCSAQGRNKPIVIGQVGTLCRHCAKIKPGLRPSGAVYFPAKLTGLYQASQNMIINHFSNNCQSIPEPLRQKLMQLKEQKSTVLGGGKLFWANCAKAIGVVEHEDQLRFEEKIDTMGGAEA